MTTVPKLQVSVAMCTYNGARFIEEQLWSIFRQSYLPVELIVSDDNSTDETLAIVQRVYETACQEIEGVDQIKLLILKNNKPLGVTKNFEQAISKCTSELVALCDQDDFWLPIRLQLMVDQFAKRPNLLLLHHDSQLIDQNSMPMGLTAFQALKISHAEKRIVHCGNALDVLLKRNIVTGATTVFKRKLINPAAPFPEFWVHDEWLAAIAASIGEIDFIDDCLIGYRQHLNNQIGLSKATFRQMIGRLIYPRTARNFILLNRAEVWFKRSVELRIREDALLKIKSKFQHEFTRNGYPRARILRTIPVTKTLIVGNYHQFGLGFQDYFRDLIQSSR